MLLQVDRRLDQERLGVGRADERHADRRAGAEAGGSATTGKPVKFQVAVKTISGSPSPPRWPES